MTSHLIDMFARRASERQPCRPTPVSTLAPPRAPGDEHSAPIESEPRVEGCTFCEIVWGRQEAYTVYEDDSVIAFLDILPIRLGHLLVCPKQHYERITNLPDNVSAAVGRAMPRIARALCRAVDQPDFNVVSNQGYAQVVDHVHFHLVPAPLLNTPIPNSKRLFARTELEDEEGEKLCRKIRDELVKEKDKAKL